MGSGGHNKHHRTIEDFRRVDSFALRRFVDDDMGRRSATFYRGAVYCDFVTCTVDIVQNGQYFPLKLDHAGGSDKTPPRLYFRCPRCDRRARYLYSCRGYHVCRKCLNANYVSQQRNRGTKAIRRRMRKIVEKELGYTRWRIENPNRGISDLGIIPKPRYMRWAKYSRLMMEYRELQDEYTRLFLKSCSAFLPAGWKDEIAALM